MILSFHPNIVAQENILCAGRLPNREDQSAICRAKAVILPQGCSEALYRMCRKYCANVFPNYDVRFDYPGKLGQARLFQKEGFAFPRTFAFDQLSSYDDRYGRNGHPCPVGFPCVFKFDWGGEGEFVFLLENVQALERTLQKAALAEQVGQKGFLLQAYVPSGGKSLRVVILGHYVFSYWRVQQVSSDFLANLKAGAVIDDTLHPGLQQVGRTVVSDFCAKTGINLAGFDLLFPEDDKTSTPLFLEINYFFGRRGLGGSARYYELVEEAIRTWLRELGLDLQTQKV